MRSARILTIVIAAVLAATACATRSPRPGTDVVSEKGPGLDRRDVVTLRARVKRVDHDTRVVTLETPEGERTTFHVDESVPNFGRIEKDDDVVVRYVRSVAFRLRKPGEATAGVSATDETARARPGDKPGMAQTRTQTITAKVAAVDLDAHEVTLEGPHGEPVRVQVDDPAPLAEVEQGDLVEVTYREALAVSVERP